MSAGNVSFVPRPLPLRLPRLCVAIAASSAADMIERAESQVRDNPFIEFRLDYLKSPGLALPSIRRFLSYHPAAIAIATCRRAVNGGKFRGSLAAQVDVLTKAAASGCQLLDLELPSASAMKPEDMERLRGRAELILSFHDFRVTRKIEQTFASMQQFPADYYKIVTTATTLFDNVAMMKFLEQTRGTHSVIGVCMGEQGIISRVLGLRAGSIWTFAAASRGEETAPGMIAAKTLRDVYRIEQVDAATRVYGVAGDPVAHSLSPQMMNAAFRRENVNAVYLALHAKTIADLLKCVHEIPIHGLSVTMPYKEEIVKHLDNSDALTQKTGACNTVVRAQDGRLYGFNTDVAGVVQPLEQRMQLPGASALVLGAGGAARAAVFGLKQRGAEVYILNRTAAKAQKLARRAHARFIRRPDVRKTQFDVILNATPVGMGTGKDSVLKDVEINARFVMDMVYDPTDTKLLKLASLRGAQVINGLEMFTNQAARQFEIWTGKPAPLAEM
ncbi:MAG: shikimate dehydrogenase, partial [Acidobacteriia bacterium]|nr:shikimate dehydrogenase [Terriglobia bacterium]